MIRHLPLIPTIIVVAAAGVMVWLGFWQLGRADEKAELIARYETALAEAEEIAWPSPDTYEASLFRRSRVDCVQVRGIDSVSGKSDRGQSGWAHIARCDHNGAGEADVAIGWSRDPNPPEWSGGSVTGIVAPYGETVKLVASEGLAGLRPLARPNPNDLPNNHLAYAGQWFFFALTALAIYGFALRSRLAKRD